MPHASLVASEIFVGSGAKKEMLVPAALPLAPPFTLQLDPFGLGQNTGRLPQHAALVLARIAVQPPLRSLVPPPPLRPSATFRPLAHNPIAKTKPRLTPLLIAFESRT